MAKGKGTTGNAAVTNRPAYSRVSFLYQAAALLAGPKPSKSSSELSISTGPEDGSANDNKTEDATTPVPMHGMARQLLSQMRSVSRKTNMRLRTSMKHRVCKYCDSLLLEGTTCVSVVENRSRGGRKSWADILAVTCTTCGRIRRYPVSAPRQPRRPVRGEAAKQAGADEEMEDEDTATANRTEKGKVQQQGKMQDKLQHTVVVGRGKGQKPANEKNGLG
ncbi:hypothetical protein SEUCBS139899_007187 [Sporothrix eucalyptigena]|uniref:Uncharacterized protein n=1 Tax=Sporothrix eucalyptigena TaxID=1812306 RepID=A0ABP0C3M7_9PEZI